MSPIVADSHISFEEQPPSLEEMRERLRAGSARYPWLVACSADGAVVGYAYAGPHRERAGYRWSADVCVYVAAQARGTGVGRKLYTQLFALLKRQGFYNAFAGVALPNDASVALHRSMGFTDVGTYRRVGFKSGAWYDTLWLQLQAAPRQQRAIRAHSHHRATGRLVCLRRRVLWKPSEPR